MARDRSARVTPLFLFAVLSFSCCFEFRGTNPCNGMAKPPTLHQYRPPKIFWSARYRATRATGSAPGVKKGVPRPYRVTSVSRLRPMLRQGGYVVLPPFVHFFFQWLGVTRASDPHVPCGHRLSRCLTFSILIRKGMVSYATPKKSPNVFFVGEVQSHSRD